MTVTSTTIGLKNQLSYLILGQKGGKNRIKILELLKERPYNLNQMAKELGLNYRTVKHHISKLLENELVRSSRTGGYGEVYFPSPRLEQNISVLDEVIDKYRISERLKGYVASPQFFRRIMEDTSEAVAIFDDQWDVYFWNPSAERVFGYASSEVMNQPLPILSDDTRTELTQRLADESHLTGIELQVENGAGDPIEISASIDGIYDDNDDLMGFSFLARDITERKRYQRRVRYLASLLRSVKDINQLIAREEDLSTLIQSASEILVDSRGYRDTLIAMIDPEIGAVVPMGHSGDDERQGWALLPDGTGDAPLCVKRALESQQTVTMVSTAKNCKECEFSVHVGDHQQLVIPVWQRKNIVGFILVCLVLDHRVDDEEIRLLEEVGRDLALARAEILTREAYCATEDRYLLACRAADMGSWGWDLARDTIALSPEVERIFGLGMRRFDGSLETMMEMVHPDDRERVRREIDAALAGEDEYETQYRIVWPDGTVRWVAMTAKIYYSEDGSEPLRLAGIIGDVTDTRRGQRMQEIDDARRLAESIFGTLREPIVVLDLEFRIVKVNAAFEALVGLAADELTGRSLFELSDMERDEATEEGGAVRYRSLWANETLRRALERVVREGGSFDDFELESPSDDREERFVLNARIMAPTAARPPLLLLAMERRCAS